MWTLLAACRREPPAERQPPTTPSPTESAAPTDSAPTSPEESSSPEPTADTGAPPAPSDPLLSGDPADLVGLVDLVWTPQAEPGRWVATVFTFARGSYGWSGQLARPPSGLDGCEVRTGDPAYVARGEGAGEVSVVSGGLSVRVDEVIPGLYQGLPSFADGDPRGRVWDLAATGAERPPIDAPGPVAFPTGELAVDPLPAELSGDPLAVRWGPADADLVAISLTAGDTLVRCAADDDGAFDVPAPLLAALPRGEVLVFVWAGHLGAAPLPDGTWVQFQAGHAVEGRFVLR